MNRQQFNTWLTDNDACAEAVQWCNEHPELSVHELIAICPRGEWILWLYERAGYAFKVLAPVAYRAATRAMGYAADILDRAGAQHGLRGLVIIDAASARAAARAARVAWAANEAALAAAWAAEWAAMAAAMAAEWAAQAAARAAAGAARAAGAAGAEHKLCADDCRAMLPRMAAFSATAQENNK